MTIKLLVVEDHALVRQGIVKLLSADPEIEVVGEADNGFDALAKAQEVKPEVILMDVHMPGLDGISVTRLVKRELPDVQVILISATVEENDVIEAIQAGARGYVVKTTDANGLIRQLKQVASGGVALSEDMTGRLVKGLSRSGHTLRSNGMYIYNSITAREKEVLGLIAQGKPNKEIATILCVSENTVRAHVRSLMQRLSLDNRTQLAVYGVREGLGTTKDNHYSPNGNGAGSENGWLSLVH